MRNVWIIGTAFLMATLIGACSSSSGTLSCSATGSVSSGSATTINQSVTLATTVSISGGSTPYSVTIPGQSVVSTSALSYSGTATVTTTGTDTFSQEVTVADSSTSVQCPITVTTTTSGSGLVNITASPSTNVSVGQQVTLTATAPSLGTATFTFAQTSTTSGVTLTPTSTSGSVGTALVTSSVEGTVTISVTATGTTTVTNTIEICFGTTGCPASSGGTSGTLTVSQIANTGNTATLLAVDTAYPSATFSFVPMTANSGITITSEGSNEAMVTGSTGTYEITVAEFNAGVYVNSTTTAVTLGYSTTGGSLVCTLNVTGGYYYIGQEITFPITTSDGEQVNISNAIPGAEGWSSVPSFPIYTNAYSPFNLTFYTVGYETVEIWAYGATSGTQCLNNPLTTTIYINQ